MKQAIQSRRKHGSIETYKQSSNANRPDQVQAIWQGQGEIVPQRPPGAVQKSSVYAKNMGVSTN